MSERDQNSKSPSDARRARLEQILLEAPEFESGRGASQEEITAVEHALGVQLRGEYRWFLERYGWLAIYGTEIFGVGQPGDNFYDIVEMTRDEREVCFPLSPHHLIPVYNDGGGNTCCLDLSADSEEPPMVWWYHDDLDGVDQVPTPEADSFLEFLVREIETDAEESARYERERRIQEEG